MHPDDEKPKDNLNEKFVSKFQHGYTKIKTNDLSIALVFRYVTQSNIYHHMDNTLVVHPNYINKNKGHFNLLYEDMINYERYLSFISDNWEIHVREKLNTCTDMNG